MRKGKLIVIEGTDGSGKKTQTNLLVEKLRSQGFKTRSFAFPQYGLESARMIEGYLNDSFGPADSVNPHAASLFYAIDRFALAKELDKSLKEGFVIILDRYVDSNAGHQGGKIPNPQKRKLFFQWLYDLEYKTLKVPKPNLVIFLHVPAKIGQEFVYKKEKRSYIKGRKTHDGHEVDIKHLKNAEKSYLQLIKQFPKNHAKIECVKNGQILPIEEIHKLIWKTITKRI